MDAKAEKPAQEASRPRRVAVLGSTGFIGRAALDVITRQPERLRVFGLAARARVDLLAEQVLRYRPEVVALAEGALGEGLRRKLDGHWRGTLLLGPKGVEELAALAEVDVLMNGLVGAAGLPPTWEALRRGKVVALANKESLVMAGELLMREAEASGGRLLPVDSEHSALFQCLDGRKEGVARLVLTASGGPFRERPLEEFAAITPEEALKHPTWDMGPRITVDSATLLNKGFEVLEARWLFGVEPSRIHVWIHPQSIVHGLVEWVDGSTTAQLSLPDMRLPIQFALCYPERVAGQVAACDLTGLAPLQFSAPDPRRYPCLEIARQVLAAGGVAPAVLNAADEVAVGAFLEGRIPFPRIAPLLTEVLEACPRVSSPGLDQILEADQWARRQAAAAVPGGH
jgi:1-deoxy-D-xylulose-5-phosphate reductoisomerase